MGADLSASKAYQFRFRYPLQLVKGREVPKSYV